jgi:hypothetical protein
MSVMVFRATVSVHFVHLSNKKMAASRPLPTKWDWMVLANAKKTGGGEALYSRFGIRPFIWHR